MFLGSLGLSAKQNSKEKKPLEFRTIDGSGNNKTNEEFGKAGVPLLRVARFASVDTSFTTRPRIVSNAVLDETETKINDRGLTDMLWQWGQFLDHDITLTEAAEPHEPLPIAIPTGDEFFDPGSSGAKSIVFNRSEFEIDTETGNRMQTNRITSFIDASNVYGSDQNRANALRTFKNGKLKTSAGKLLPFNVEQLENSGSTMPSLFLAGDLRANEQVGLASMHTLFVREHNRYAKELKRKNKKLNDEELYQRARAYVGALMQVITVKEFLPALFGKDLLGPYPGYNAEIDPGIMNVFSTAAFRFGHSVVSPTLMRLDNKGNEIEAGNLSLRDSFFRPDHIKEFNDIGFVLKGLSTQKMRELDVEIIDDLRNFLFGEPGNGGMDLAALNIQRGNDHALAPYCQIRRDFDLPCSLDFTDITTNTDLATKLQSVYNDTENIDVWVAILAEDHLPGSSAGELMTTIITQQFKNLRNGDRFWYENTFSGKQLKKLEKTKLSDIIKRNTKIRKLQKNVFFN